MFKYILREVQDNEMSFLEKMLYGAVFWRTTDDKPSLEECLSLPDVSKVLADWGNKEGDVAVIATHDSIPIGAAWLRYWTDDNNTRGYFEESTPVLVIGVHSDYRHKGIGKKLIGWLIDYASAHGIEKISLAVSKDNYALNLYRQEGFIEYDDCGDSYIMVYTL